MNRRKIFAVAAVMAALAGCSKEPVRDVPYYSEHTDARIAKLKECATSPGEHQADANCVNAQAAQKELDRKALAAEVSKRIAAENAKAKALFDELGYK